MATKKVETKATETVNDTAIVEVKKEVPAVKKEVEKAVPAVQADAEKTAPAAKKETVKKEAVKKETVKKAPVKKEPAKKAEPQVTAKEEIKPAEKKAPAKKTPAKKELKASVVVEYSGKQVIAKTILEQAKKAFTKANKGVEIKTIDLYIKPEEHVAYYVVNGIGSEDYKVEL